jgi:hypothetical protein
MRQHLGFSIPDTKTEFMDQNPMISSIPQLKSHALHLTFPHLELKIWDIRPCQIEQLRAVVGVGGW